MTSAKQITEAVRDQKQLKADYDRDVEKMLEKHRKDLKPISGEKRKNSHFERFGVSTEDANPNKRKRIKAVAGENMVKVKKEPGTESDLKAKVTAIHNEFVDVVLMNQNLFVQKS